MISPKITMENVDTRNPTVPDVTSAMRMERAEFTATFPSNRVQSSKFPFLRSGWIFLASRCLSGWPDSATICNMFGVGTRTAGA
jgi:hypothetical protein